MFWDSCGVYPRNNGIRKRLISSQLVSRDSKLPLKDTQSDAMSGEN